MPTSAKPANVSIGSPDCAPTPTPGTYWVLVEFAPGDKRAALELFECMVDLAEPAAPPPAATEENDG